jgi:hypothetical protein
MARFLREHLAVAAVIESHAIYKQMPVSGKAAPAIRMRMLELDRQVLWPVSIGGSMRARRM